VLLTKTIKAKVTRKKEDEIMKYLLTLIFALFVVSCDSENDDENASKKEQVCTKYSEICGATSSELQQWVDECVLEYRATPEEEDCILNSSATSCDEIKNECANNGIF
jgi:hypothetical protein